MSFDADKKREHAALAEQAIDEGGLGRAAFHFAKAADFALKLAGKCTGKVRQAHLREARELVELAEQLQARARSAAPPASKPVKEVDGPAEGTADSPWALQERPTIKLADVAGLEDVKATLHEKVILPFLQPEVFRRFKAKLGAGVLMYGPPGNGKTYVAKAIAGELDAAFFPVNASQIKDKYVGESEKNMQRLFDEARKHERAVLFIDEAEHLLSKRGNRKIGVVTQFLTLADGLVENQTCLLILAATNKPWSLDEAVIRPGRLGTHVYVGPPDEKARAAIISSNLKGVPVAGEVSAAALAGRTQGYSGADVAAVCDRAKMMAIKRELQSGKPEEISAADFTTAVEQVKPSVSDTQIEEYLQWRDSKHRPEDANTDDTD